MAENGIGDFYIMDADDVAEIGGVRVPPVILPSTAAQATQAQVTEEAAPPAAPPVEIPPIIPVPEPVGEVAAEIPEEPELESVPAMQAEEHEEPAEPAAPVQSAPTAPSVQSEPVMPPAPPAFTAEPAPPIAEVAVTAPAQVAPSVTHEHPTREQRLIAALDALMDASEDIAAAALVSLDGFIMAAALPEGMHEDKVGAMSAAILGLGERAAIELGRGNLTQVFIEGEGGYVVLIAVGDRAVLTVLAGEQAKLGLVLYDMRTAAETIARLLG